MTIQRPRSTSGSQEVELGSLEDIKTRSSCTSCQDIVEVIQHGNYRPSAHLLLKVHFLNYDIPLTHHGLFVHDGLFVPQLEYLRLYRIEAPTFAHHTGRICDPQQLDIDLMRKWISRCQASHKGSAGSRFDCLSTTLPLPSHQIYLVDVQAACLVQRSAACKYTALSYVWGKLARSHTTKSNLRSLQMPGSLSADAGHLVIPKAIKDAMKLVSFLGERYLWVDSFCIVQDDVDTKQLQIDSMAQIYANAYITIVAADGKDADHGIRGVDGSGEARKMGYSTIRLPDGSRIIASPTQMRLLQDTTWASRGWTFQEALFSRRMLVFNGSVTWMCHAATYEEPIRAPAEDDNPIYEELQQQLLGSQPRQWTQPRQEPRALHFAMSPPLGQDFTTMDKPCSVV
ncbi:MAG: hypothetical protein Q9226_007937 [Calogaya cf. arnoldii]